MDARYLDVSLVDASSSGMVEQVTNLLRQGVNPSSEGSASIRYACMNGRTEVVRLLVSDGRVMMHPIRYLLIDACTRGQTDIVEIFLNEGSLDPDDLDAAALRTAVAQGHQDVVRLLLDDGRANPTARNQEAMITAIERGYVEIAEELLEDGRVDVHYRDGLFYRMARYLGRSELEQLFGESRMRASR